jgi:dephospho-CoA kinase
MAEKERHRAGSKLLVGLTGGIGSGKSIATAFFEELGVPVIDADLAAREVVATGTAALAAIASHFGPGILLPSGELDRGALRQRVFADAAERQWLEALLHPLIRASLVRQLAAAVALPETPYAILSNPLLLETGQDALVHRVLLIDASEALQRERTLRRDASDARTVDAIIAAQWNREQRREKADDVILNEGDLQELHSAVRALDERYRRLAATPTPQEGRS